MTKTAETPQPDQLALCLKAVADVVIGYDDIAQWPKAKRIDALSRINGLIEALAAPSPAAGLRERILALPRRVEPLGGQQTSYVQLDNVLALLEAERAQLKSWKRGTPQRYACLPCSEKAGTASHGPHITHAIGDVCPERGTPTLTIDEEKDGEFWSNCPRCGERSAMSQQMIDRVRDYRRATTEERAMARGFVTLWESVGVQDAEDWLYVLRNRAELLACLDEDDNREAQDNTPSLGPFPDAEPSTPAEPQKTSDCICINCEAVNEGGYMSGFDEGQIDDGAVGPFCVQCWEYLRETFTRKAERGTPAETSKDYKALYHELLYEVAMKHPGESRHETARRYIREREMPNNDQRQQTTTQQEPEK